jgi:hypothetical protein
MQALAVYHREQLPRAVLLEQLTVQLCPTRAERYTRPRPVVIDELIRLTEVRLAILRSLSRLSVGGALEMLSEISDDLRKASAPRSAEEDPLLLPTEPPPVSPYWEHRQVIAPPPPSADQAEEQMIPATPSATMAPDSESAPPRAVDLPSGIEDIAARVG